MAKPHLLLHISQKLHRGDYLRFGRKSSSEMKICHLIAIFVYISHRMKQISRVSASSKAQPSLRADDEGSQGQSELGAAFRP
jgi:hypothetical protein